MPDLNDLLIERLKSESRKYLDLREELNRTREDRDKVMKRLRLLRDLLALDGEKLSLPEEE
jgi:hypothetical protein